MRKPTFCILVLYKLGSQPSNESIAMTDQIGWISRLILVINHIRHFVSFAIDSAAKTAQWVVPLICEDLL